MSRHFATGIDASCVYLFRMWAVLSLLALAACSERSDTYQLSGASMGTTYHITLVVEGDSKQPDFLAQVQRSVDAALDSVNAAMSTYIESSEISRFNHSSVGEVTPISRSTQAVLEAAFDIHDRSDGYFDITVMPLVRLWGFGPDQRDSVPAPELVQQKLAMIDQSAVGLDRGEGTLKKLKPVEVDLSAIAKGYGVDVVFEVLKSHGLNHFLVEIGGEIRVSGHKPGNQVWRVGIEKPELAQRKAQQVIELRDISIATSGDYRNFFEMDGQKFSHTIDTRTGYPVRSRLASVSVLASNCMLADAWATALMAMGDERALAFAESEKLVAYFLLHKANGEGIEQVFSNGFDQYLAEL